MDYIRSEGRAGRIGAHLLAVVAESNWGRQYCKSSFEDLTACQNAAKLVVTASRPVGNLPPKGKGLGFRVQNYGLEEWWELFTERQLLALSTFSDLLNEVTERIINDARAAELSLENVCLRDGGSGIEAYADAIITYLSFGIDRCADYWSKVCLWGNSRETIAHTFGRQAIPMTWDFVEANPFSSSTGNWQGQLNWICRAVEHFPATGSSEVCQSDARARTRDLSRAVISTDPPYYDNIGYADVSDFFYIWLRRNLADIWYNECATIYTPKAQEMIADPVRHGGVDKAKEHFESGMAEFMTEVAATQHPDAPATIYYGYKATESQAEGKVNSTGWDTFLQAVIDAGLQVTATWPLRTEYSNRPRSVNSNALASSIVLACRPRSKLAPLATSSEFVNALRIELPSAIELLQSGSIAPVDLPQSTIGPGIKVFSRYAKVVEANGSTMPVSDALAIINEVLDDVLHGEESELDSDTRFALAWYTQHGFDTGPFGDADSIARAKNTAVDGVVKAGVGEASGGKFRLFDRSELDTRWDPAEDSRLTAWEALQHLAVNLEQSESQAARLLARLGGVGDHARELAYLLYMIASDNDWSEEADTYNSLVATWSRLLAIRPRMTENKLWEK